MKKAYLVYTTFICRVVADEDADEDAIADLAKDKLVEKLNNNEIYENVENIVEDTDVPYNPEYDK